MVWCSNMNGRSGVAEVKQKFIAMKRFVYTALFLAIFATSFGQKHIRLSFAANPSVNWLNTNGSEVDRRKPGLGYDFGLNTDFYISDDERYGLSTGLLITNVGGQIAYAANRDFEFSGATMPAHTSIKYRLKYVEVPLMIKLKTDSFGRYRYWGQFGFSGMINIEARGSSDNGFLKKSNIHDEVNLFNLAMNIGLGYDYDLGGNNAISVGLLFQNGLIDVTTDNYFSDKTIINSLKLKLGLIF